ncbi:MAG: hypothetical protein JST36_10640 [Bacteroidetes bacterium]|nr:hypothetical protein [Bacteroidota bacterium]
MSDPKLQDTLLEEFRQSKKMVHDQIALFEPLASSMRKPAAQRLAQNGLLFVEESLCWLLVLACIAVGIFLNKLYPFYVLFELSATKAGDAVGHQNIQMLRLAIYALIGLCGILFLIQARSLRKIRKKNTILSLAGKDIKTIIGQLLQRKAAIEVIEQKYFDELPSSEPINQIPNPDYDADDIQATNTTPQP